MKLVQLLFYSHICITNNFIEVANFVFLQTLKKRK